MQKRTQKVLLANKLPLKHSNLKQQTVSVVRNLGAIELGVSSSPSLMMLQTSCQPGYRASQGLMGAETCSRLTHMVVGTSILHHTGFPQAAE